MSGEYDVLVFIGRFQPFHKGHLKVVTQALSEASNLLILCGSANQPRSYRNPWLVPEREQMIRACLSADDQSRVIVQALEDDAYNDKAWVDNVRLVVEKAVGSQKKIGLIGHNKDHSSYYLSLFPQWGSVAVADYQNLSATPIRERFFMAAAVDAEALPEAVVAELTEFMSQEAYADVRGEFEYVAKYQRQWASAPYPPIFVTVDAVVRSGSKVLLIERKAPPGKGLWALPGGFLDPHETLLNACLRELQEETQLRLSTDTINRAKHEVFDAPYRSCRGRTITHAFYFEIEGVPEVIGTDDAEKAVWVELDELDPSQMLEDHYFIIQKMKEGE